MIVKVVQPNLTPGNDLRAPRQLLKFLKVGVRSQFSFVRMDPDCGQDKFVPLCQLNAAVQRAGTRSTANGDDLLNAAVPRPGDHEFAVRVELLHFEMSVGDYKHSRWSFVIGRWSLGSAMAMWGRVGACPERSQSDPSRPSGARQPFFHFDLFQPGPQRHILQEG